MKKTHIVLGFLMAIALVAVSAPLRAEPSDAGGQSAGWSPAEANQWMDAQMKYAQAVKQYGKDSPEATQAQVMMNTLARDLGIKPTNEVPEQASMDMPIAAPDADEDPTAVARQASKDPEGAADINPDRPQPAPQDLQQVAEPAKAADTTPDPAADTTAPTPARATIDTPTPN